RAVCSSALPLPTAVLLADRHPFPTRRSSDLAGGERAAGRSRAVPRRTGRRAVSRTDGEGGAEDTGSGHDAFGPAQKQALRRAIRDRKSTRLNSSHVSISYAVFCLKTKRQDTQ